MALNGGQYPQSGENPAEARQKHSTQVRTETQSKEWPLHDRDIAEDAHINEFKIEWDEDTGHDHSGYQNNGQRVDLSENRPIGTVTPNVAFITKLTVWDWTELHGDHVLIDANNFTVDNVNTLIESSNNVSINSPVINVDASMLLNINARDFNINVENDLDIDTDDLIIDATGGVVITTPLTTHNGDVNIVGSLTITGDINAVDQVVYTVDNFTFGDQATIRTTLEDNVFVYGSFNMDGDQFKVIANDFDLTIFDEAVINAPNITLNGSKEIELNTPNLDINSSCNVDIEALSFPAYPYDPYGEPCGRITLRASRLIEFIAPDISLEGDDYNATMTNSFNVTSPNIDINSSNFDLDTIDYSMIATNSAEFRSDDVDIEGYSTIDLNTEVLTSNATTKMDFITPVFNVDAGATIDLESGNLIVIYGPTIDMNSTMLDIDTTNMTVDAVQNVTFQQVNLFVTSSAETEINSNLLDINTTTLTDLNSPNVNVVASNEIDFLTNVFDLNANTMDFDGQNFYLDTTILANITSGMINFQGNSQITQNTQIWDVNVTNLATLDAVNEFEINTALLDVNSTHTLIDGNTAIITQSTEAEINAPLIDLNGSNQITLDTPNLDITAPDIDVVASAEFQLDTALLDLNAINTTIDGNNLIVNEAVKIEGYAPEIIWDASTELTLVSDLVDIDGNNQITIDSPNLDITSSDFDIVAATELEIQTALLDIDATTTTMDGDDYIATMTNEYEINADVLDLNIGNTVDLTAPTIILNGTTEVEVNSPLFDVNADDMLVDGNNAVFVENVKFQTNAPLIDLNASTELELSAPTVDLDGSTIIDVDTPNLDIDATATTIDGDNLTITESIETEINSPVIDLNGSSQITIDTPNLDLTAPDIDIVASTEFQLDTPLFDGNISDFLVDGDNAVFIESVKFQTNAPLIDLNASTELELSALTVDLDGSTIIDVDTPNLDIDAVVTTIDGINLTIIESVEAEINSPLIDLNGGNKVEISAPTIDIDGASLVDIDGNIINVDSVDAIFNQSNEFEVTADTIDLNGSIGVTIDAPDMDITVPDLDIVSTTEVQIDSPLVDINSVLVDISGNLDVGNGLDVIGNITVTGLVDSIDVANHNHEGGAAQGVQLDHGVVGNEKALFGLGPNDHHPQVHTHDGVDGSGTIAHVNTTGRTANDHHNKMHAHDGVDGSGTVAHFDITNITTDDHHPQLHTIFSHDTVATGSQLDILVGGNFTTLHKHQPELVIQDEGIGVPTNPYHTLNFKGTGVTVTNAGPGIADIDIPLGTDELIKVTSNDGLTGYLYDKVIGTSGKIVVTEVNDGGNEDLKINIGLDVFDKMADDLDDVPNGVTYGRVLNTELLSGQVTRVRAVSAAANVTGDQIYNHINDFTNPHVVTAVQVGKDTAQWNADEIQGVFVDNTDIGEGKVLKYNSTTGNLEYEDESASVNPLSIIQVRRVSTTTFSDSWANQAFDTQDVESRPSVIEWDATGNTYRVLVKENGWFFMYYAFTATESGGAELQSRVMVDDTTVIPGSLAKMRLGTDVLTAGFAYYVTAGSYLTFQIQRVGGTSGVGVSDVTFVAFHMKGTKGDQGDTGSGSNVTIKDEGTNVPNTPHSILNFTGAGVTVSDAGSGTATVNIPGTNIFGSQFQEASSEDQSSTTSSSFVQKLRMTTGNLPLGKYRIGWSLEAWAGNGIEFDVRVQINDSINIMDHIEETDSSGNIHVLSGFSYQNSFSGVKNIDIDYCAELGYTGYIRRARLEIWRVE